MAKGSSRDWLEAIAAKAKVDPDMAERILDTKGIRPSPVIATPRRLAVHRIEFSGVKTDVPGAGQFEFVWDNLGPGLWAMVTERNLRGKSSVIEIAKWLLRGRPSRRLQDDVRTWLRSCRLVFTLDDIFHEVRLETSMTVTGRLVRTVSGEEIELAQFVGEDEFEAVMSDFFLKEFGLDVVARWKSGTGEDGGRTVLHGWLSLSGAMFIGTDYSVLLGDMPPQSGMATPLMQMYLGLPWVSTLTAAKAAEQVAKKEQEARERKRELADAGRTKRRDEIATELEKKKAERDATPSDEELRARMARFQVQLAADSASEAEMSERAGRARADLRDAEAAYLADRADLQAHIDAEAAGAVFRMLDPSFCPRCDTVVTEERRKREKETHSCSVCGEHVSEQDDAASILAGMEVRAKASKAARDKAQRLSLEAQKKLDEVQARLFQIREEIEDLAKNLTRYDARRNLDTEVAILEARLQEAGHDPEIAATDGAELPVLVAAVAETEKRVKAVQEGLLKAVSEEIVRYASRFGIANISSATLKGNTHLRLVKGGSETSYGKCTDGEKLRLKVAALLAMIKVGETRHVGRHPGLLMIDSPGAQEIAREDLDQLIGGLEEVSKEFGHLQVFIAAMSSPAVVDHVPAERMRDAEGDAPLW
jgi:hypothetical protein